MELVFDTGSVGRCPECGHNVISARVVTWADFKDGRPYRFDPEDIDYVEAVAGGDAVCRSCAASFKVSEYGCAGD